MSTQSIFGGTSVTFPTTNVTTRISNTTDTYYMNTPKNVLTVGESGKLELRGDNADIVIGERSLVETLERIEQQLNIITQRPDLEARWAKLTQAREAYEACLADVIEKDTIWRELQR